MPEQKTGITPEAKIAPKAEVGKPVLREITNEVIAALPTWESDEIHKTHRSSAHHMKTLETIQELILQYEEQLKEVKGTATPDQEFTAHLEEKLALAQKAASPIKEMLKEILLKELKEVRKLTPPLRKRLAEAKKAYQKEHPTHLEESEILFGLPLVLQRTYEHNIYRRLSELTEEELKRAGVEEKEREIRLGESLKDVRTQGVRRTFLQFAGFQLHTTRYLLDNAHNQDHLRSFWNCLGEIAKASPTPDSLDLYRRHRAGPLAQAAASHIMRRLGCEPQLPTAREDAFEGTDIHARFPKWKVPIAIQVKTQRKLEDVSTEVAGYNTFPLVASVGGRIKLYKSPEQEGQPIPRRILLELPHKAFDPITGVPTEEAIEKCRKQLESIMAGG